MNATLNSFKLFETDINELQKCFGDDLYNAEISTPKVVEALEVVNAIHKFRNGEITKETLIAWVNTLWFTDLYEYCEDNEESIASVMTLLETLDEEGVDFTEDEYNRMIEALKNNEQYAD